MALANIGDHRKASGFALTGFIGLLLSALIRAAATLMTLPEYRGNTPIREIANQLVALNYLATLLTVVAMVLLMVAIFTDLERPRG